MSTWSEHAVQAGLPEPLAERARELAHVGRTAVRRGLVLGSGGNLSARDPATDLLVVTASGTWLDDLAPEDWSVVRLADGEVVAGHPRPSSELALHVHAYRARPDRHALVHLHPQTSVLLDALGYEVRLLTIDHAYYIRSVRRTPYVRSGTVELAEAAARQHAAGGDCVLLAHHGCSCLGATVEAAAKAAYNLEEAAEATYRMLLLGDTTTACPPEYLATVRAAEADADVPAPPVVDVDALLRRAPDRS